MVNAWYRFLYSYLASNTKAYLSVRALSIEQRFRRLGSVYEWLKISLYYSTRDLG